MFNTESLHYYTWYYDLQCLVIVPGFWILEYQLANVVAMLLMLLSAILSKKSAHKLINRY